MVKAAAPVRANRPGPGRKEIELGTKDRISEVREHINPLDCRRDAYRGLEVEEELVPDGAWRPLSLTAWDWVRVGVGAVVALGLFWVMAAGWPLLAVIGGAR